MQWYFAIRTVVASRSSSAMSRSLTTDSVFDCSGISVRSVGNIDFCWDYSFHLISERKGGYAGWSTGYHFAGPKYPEEFVHPLAFN